MCIMSIAVNEQKSRNNKEVLLIFDNQNLFTTEGHLMQNCSVTNIQTGCSALDSGRLFERL